MSLRAGYYGLKGTMSKVLEKLAKDTSGMKIIKSIGNGLKLSNAGALSADIDTDTMEFKGGKLAAKITSGYDTDVLFGSLTYTYPASTSASIELSESYEDYDMLCVICGFIGADNAGLPLYIPVDMLKETGGDAARSAVLVLGNSQYVIVSKGSDTTHLSMTYAQGCGVHCVIGIKY